ncbi:MAG: DoxX family protein [Actinomycetes bacterium]
MFIACVIVSAVAALALLASAAGKLSLQPKVVESLHGVCGVPLRSLPLLAALEIAAAIGIVIGLWWVPLGIAAAIGAVAYFVGAILAHVRVKDFTGMVGPVVPLALMVATFVLRIVTA